MAARHVLALGTLLDGSEYYDFVLEGGSHALVVDS
jgi:hypothetical protein